MRTQNSAKVQGAKVDRCEAYAFFGCAASTSSTHVARAAWHAGQKFPSGYPHLRAFRFPVVCTARRVFGHRGRRAALGCAPGRSNSTVFGHTAPLPAKLQGPEWEPAQV